MPACDCSTYNATGDSKMTLVDYDCEQQYIDNSYDNYPGGTCQYIRNGFCPPSGNYDFLEMYYCGLENAFGKKGKIVAFVFVGGLLMFIGMYLLGSTADVYLSPCLEYLVVRFGISESLAGVTLLAFGNGAPDVFGSIAAAGDSNSDTVPDANKAVCILVGGTFFICTVVIALTTFAGTPNPDGDTPIRQIKVTPRYFIRDIAFFLFTSLYLIFAMLVVQGIDIYISVGFIVIYITYVIWVVCQSKNKTEDDTEDIETDKKA